METLALILRVVVSLGAVLALVWWFQRRLTRSARASGAEPLVRVVSRQAITPKASVVVMETGGQRFLLGVTEASVNVLHTSQAELPPPVSFETHLETAVHIPAHNPPRSSGPRRRAEAPAHALNGQPEAGHPLLAGSVLSPATWRQAAAALRRGRNG